MTGDMEKEWLVESGEFSFVTTLHYPLSTNKRKEFSFCIQGRAAVSRLFDITSRVLEAVIAGAKLRHQVIVNNIANVDTPGFQSADLEFEKAFRAYLSPPETAPSQTFEEHIERLSNKELSIAVRLLDAKETPPNPSFGIARDRLNAKIVLEAYDQPRLDGNTVDIDREMAKLSKNTLLHNTYVELLNRKYRMLKTAITGSA
jgi:flagellar basal-body rod protein FlgB